MRKKIATQDLKFGMYVDELDIPWSESPFLFQGFPIRTENELKLLSSLCSYVYIFDQELAGERSRHRFSTGRINISKPKKISTKHTADKQDHHHMVKELQHIKKTYDQTHQYVVHTLNSIRLGEGVNVDTAKDLVSGMTESIIQNENALVLLSQLKQHDEYTVRHSLNVCILSLLLGKHLDFTENNLRALGLGALLHDIGKMKLPDNILNKPGKLDYEEFELIKEHPDIGYRLLKLKKGIPWGALDVVRSHHERIDGTGYPRGLEGERVGMFPRITAVVDVYDAITTNRAYHDGISPHEALKLMYESQAGAFPEELLDHFIQCLSIFPIGSVVELDNGNVGIVMSVNRRKHLLPIVLLVLNKDKAPFFPRKVCNLELMEMRGSAVHIKKILQSNAYDINTSKVLLEERGFNALQLEQ
ncbi:HD-GYP domain-containing protein [Pseudomonadota bacterium]